jgi:hypothetical protein
MCYTLAPILYNKGGRKVRISLGHAIVLYCSHRIMLQRSQTHLRQLLQSTESQTLLDTARKDEVRITGLL